MKKDSSLTKSMLKAFGMAGSLLWVMTSLAWAQEQATVSFGTGFSVTDQGHVITAYHVIRDKSQVLVGPEEKNRWRIAQVVKVDEKNDLALLKTSLSRPPLPIAHGETVPTGLEAFVIGYPQPPLMGLSKKITQGIVNGEGLDRRGLGHFQLSAEIQKGNSGGPVLAPDGTVIGVVSSKLNALSVAERTKDLPQNVNYALKSSVLLDFLGANGIVVEGRPPDLQMTQRPYQVFRMAEASIVAIMARTPPVTKKPASSGSTVDGEEVGSD